MNITYRPIGTDWPGVRTLASARRDARFLSPRKQKPDGSWTPMVRTSWNDTLALLDTELGQLGAEAVVFQLDVREGDIRLDGHVRADARPSDPAVIVSFESTYGPLRYFCDRFTDWHDNVRAIALGLEALRKVERYGITKKGQQYTGWKALPPGKGESVNVVINFPGPREAARFMVEQAGHDGRGIDESIQLLLVHRAYRDDIFKRAALKLHPDKGGSRADWDTLVEARRVVESA